MAYCERFPRAPTADALAQGSSNSSDDSRAEFWAQVGKSDVPRSNFDNIGWALLTVFQMLTAENWNNVMYSGMVATSPWCALFFVLVVVVGNYILLNLFLAVLLENFGTPGDDNGAAGPEVPLWRAVALAKLQQLLEHSWFAQRHMATRRGNRVMDSGADGADGQPAAATGEEQRQQHEQTEPKQAWQLPVLEIMPREERQQQEEQAKENGLHQEGTTIDTPRQLLLGNDALVSAGLNRMQLGRLPLLGFSITRPSVRTPGFLSAANPLIPEPARPSFTGASFTSSATLLGAKGLLLGGSQHTSPTRREPFLESSTVHIQRSSCSSPCLVGYLQQQQQQEQQEEEGGLPRMAERQGGQSFTDSLFHRGARRSIAAALVSLEGQSSGGSFSWGSPGLNPRVSTLGGGSGTFKPLKAAQRSNAAVSLFGPGAFKDLLSRAGSRADMSELQGQKGRAATPPLQQAGTAAAPTGLGERLSVVVAGTGGSRQSIKGAGAWPGEDWQPGSSSSSRRLGQGTESQEGNAAGAAVSRDEELQGRSLLLFGPSNWLRLRLAGVVAHPMFENLLLLLILVSSITLALDTPGLDPNSRMKKVLEVLDLVFIALFTLEAVVKILVKGLLLTGRTSYLRNAWNVLDFLVVVTGLVMATMSASGADTSQLSALRALRTLRALRPLRMASRLQGMKVVVNALFASIPTLLNVLLVCLLFYFIFGIMAVDMFAGSLFECQDGAGNRLDPDYLLPSGQSMTRDWCLNGPSEISSSAYHSSINVSVPAYNFTRRWVGPRAGLSFDNVPLAMLALFQISTTELWIDTTMRAVDAVGLDQQPITNHNPAVVVFFVAFMIFGCFFVLQLFISVTIEKFAEIADSKGGSAMLTPQQQQWLTIERMLAATQPEVKHAAPDQPLRAVIHHMVESTWFEWLVMGLILGNMVILAMTHYNMSHHWVQAMSYANVGFTALFGLEALLKAVAYGPKEYIQDGCCRFDLIVVCVSVVGVAIDLSSVQDLPYLPILRVLRVVRVFRLIPKAKGLRSLLQTLVFSLPALGNVGSVLFLFLFIYAVIGMNLFGNVRYGQYLTVHANFHDMGYALLTLFRMITGESWGGIMQDCMISSDCLLVAQSADVPLDGNNSSQASPSSSATAATTATVATIAAGTYLSPGDPLLGLLPKSTVLDQCSPSPIAAAAFFCTFVILCGLILVNFVIGVIIDNMQSSNMSEALPVSRTHLMQFVEAWGELDPQGTNYIHAMHLATLISELDPPVGVKGEEGPGAKIQAIVMSVDIPIRDNKVHFLETLHALAGRVAGTEVPEAEELPVHQRMSGRLPTSCGQGAPKHTVAHFYAALHVQAAIKGFLQRHALQASAAGAQQ